ncbi:MAG TPA: LPS assembly lipoprotein LptE [Mariprofundaceae bacterium]|nr:LPS assembly lipoprotein LptE [Mariprofundaceae bacterium]
MNTLSGSLRLFPFAVWFCTLLVLSGCGYHLAGQGRGMMPADVKTIFVSGSGDAAKQTVPLMRNYVRDHADGYTVTKEQDLADAELHIGDMTESFTPSAFDTQGVVTTYTLTLSGSLSLLKGGESIWSSGSIRQTGTVYAVGGPAGIESNRARMREDLQRQWVQEAWVRLASGF